MYVQIVTMQHLIITTLVLIYVIKPSCLFHLYLNHYFKFRNLMKILNTFLVNL